MDPATPIEADGETIDEIARRNGIPVSTVRLYQNKGLLPPPERRGRVGYYGPGHQARLHVIAHLQDRGFSLAAIKESLESWNAGHSLGDLLGVSMVAPGLVRDPLVLSTRELMECFEGVELTQADIRRAVELGLLQVDGSKITIANRAFADVGPAVVRLGIPVAVVLDEYEALGEMIDEIAARFRAVFERHLWEPFVAGGMPPDDVPTLTNQASRLSEFAANVVTVELQDRLAGFVRDYLERAGWPESEPSGED